MTTSTKNRKPAQKNAYTGPAIFRVSDKATGRCLGYLVPADSAAGQDHKVTYDSLNKEYRCDCSDAHYRGRVCKHIDCVVSNVAARKELAVAALIVECQIEADRIAAEEAAAEVQAATAIAEEAARKAAQERKHAVPLLGSVRPFSLMAPAR